MRILLIIIFLLSVTACQSRPAYDPMSAQLHQHADYIEQLANNRQLEWNDFLAEPLNFIVYQPQGAALLITHSAPVEGFSEQHGNRYFYPAGLPHLTGVFTLNYAAGDITMTAVSLRNTPQDTAELFFHEHFHSYQDQSFSATALHRTISSEHFTNSQVRALLQMRRQLLSQAVQNNNSASNYLADLIVLDHLLAMQFDDAAMKHLYQMEIIEGTAEYAEIVLNHQSPSAISAQIQEQLAQPEHGVHSANDLRFYSYPTGAAITYLLHQLNPQTPNLVETHNTLNDVIATHFNISLPAQYTDEELAEILSRYNIERWLVWAMNETPAQAFTLQRFRQLTSASVTINLTLVNPEAASHMDMNFAGGTQSMHQPDEGGFILPEPESVSVHGRATSLVIRQTPTYQYVSSQSPMIHIESRVDSLPDLCSGQSSCTLDSLKLDWQGIELEHNAKTHIKQQGDALIISIEEH